MMVKAILFDMEGVVIDSAGIWDDVQRIFLKKWDIIYDRNKTKHLLTGRSIEDGIKIMQEIYPQIEGNIKDLVNQRCKIAEDLFKTKINFIVGFLDFRNYLKDDYRICIATAMYRSLLEKVNNKLGLDEIFNNQIFSIDDVGGKSKPNPDIFLYALKKLNVECKDCIVIEDAPNGIEAAKRAGIFVIGITTTYDRDKLKNADLIVDNFKEVEIFLNSK